MRRDILEAYDTSGRSSNWRFGSVVLVSVSPQCNQKTEDLLFGSQTGPELPKPRCKLVNPAMSAIKSSLLQLW